MFFSSLKHPYMRKVLGCARNVWIFISKTNWLTISDSASSCLFTTFMAKTNPNFFSRTTYTSPKRPLPSFFPISNWFKLRGAFGSTLCAGCSFLCDVWLTSYFLLLTVFFGSLKLLLGVTMVFTALGLESSLTKVDFIMVVLNYFLTFSLFFVISPPATFFLMFLYPCCASLALKLESEELFIIIEIPSSAPDCSP